MVIIDLILLVAFLSSKCKSSFQVPAHIHKSARFRQWTKSCHGGLRFISSPSIVDRFTFHPINRPIKAIIQPKKILQHHILVVLYRISTLFSFGFERPKFNVLLNRAHIRRRPLSSRGRRRRMWPSVFSLSIRPACVPASGVCVCRCLSWFYPRGSPKKSLTR